MDAKNDGGKAWPLDLRRLTDGELGHLIDQARTERLERLHFAVYSRGIHVDPTRVADAMLRRGLWGQRA
jgi:hypothetical protein